MSFHHLIRNCVLSPRSGISKVSFRVPDSRCYLAKTFVRPHSGQQFRQHISISRACSAQSNPDLIVSCQPLLALSRMTDLQSKMQFSSSTINCAFKQRGNKGNDDVTSSKQSLFDFFSLHSLLSTPTPYMLYGISGLIPFVSVPVYMFMTSTYCPLMAHAQLVYGACILSFLGGVAWGSELKTPEISDMMSLGYSVSLPLIAWVGALAYPNVAAFPIVMAGVILAGFTDIKIQFYPRWFKNLRFLLSSLVLLSLMSTFTFSLVFPDSSSKKKVGES